MGKLYITGAALLGGFLLFLLGLGIWGWGYPGHSAYRKSYTYLDSKGQNHSAHHYYGYSFWYFPSGQGFFQKNVRSGSLGGPSRLGGGPGSGK